MPESPVPFRWNRGRVEQLGGHGYHHHPRKGRHTRCPGCPRPASMLQELRVPHDRGGTWVAGQAPGDTYSTGQAFSMESQEIIHNQKKKKKAFKCILGQTKLRLSSAPCTLSCPEPTFRCRQGLRRYLQSQEPHAVHLCGKRRCHPTGACKWHLSLCMCCIKKLVEK